MLTLNLLGTPEIKKNDAPLSLGTAKARALLLYLAVTGRPHSREQLLDLLWSTLPTAKARRNLTATLSSLRKEIDEYVLVDGDTIRFNFDLPHQLDTAVLTNALQSGDVAQLQQAITLYRGRFLTDLTVKNAFIFEEWVITESGRIREQMVQALSLLLDTAMANRVTNQALGYATQLLEIEPWLEHAHRQLMLLYARLGQVSDALAQYKKCRDILASELGIEPAGETDHLYERLLLIDQEGAAPLPEDPSPFIGREEELTHIAARVTQPTCRLLTIVGLGGMGKTRLAIAAARQIMQQDERPFLNGAVFVSLVGVLDSNSLLSAILTALNVTPGRRRLIDQVIDALKQRELLLILDNFEELLAEISLVQQIIAACPDITLLITSREALGISAEHRLDLDGMAIPPETSSPPEEAAQYEAVALFLNLAPQTFTLNQKTLPPILTLCQLVDGMPLALKLAATWLRTIEIANIVIQLQTGVDLLATSQPDIPERQRSIETIFDQTMAMLLPDEAAVLYGLSVFRGGFTATAARAVAQATPFILSELVDRGLIQLGVNGRYQMHELLRQYAARHRDPALTLAHATYFAERLVEREAELTDERQAEALKLITIEVNNVTAAWRYALAEKRFDLLAQSASALCRFARLRGRYPEGIADLEPAVQAARTAGETAVEAKLSDLLGTLYFFSGDHHKAKDLYQTALNLAEQINNTAVLANATFHLSQAIHFEGDLEQARQLSEKAYHHYTQADNPRGLVGATNMLGQMDRYLGHITESRYWFEASISLARSTHDYFALLVPLNNYGLLLHELGEFQSSLKLFEESEQIVEQLGLGRDGLVMMNFGRNYEALGEIDKAADAYLGAIPVFDSQHERHYFLVAHNFASRAVRLQGDLPRARQLAQTALDGFRTTNTRFSIATALANLGDVEFAAGNTTATLQAYEEVLPIMATIKQTDGRLRIIIGLAHLSLLSGDLITARRHLTQAIQLATETHVVMYQYHLLAIIALYHITHGEIAQGKHIFRWLTQQPRAFWETRHFAEQQLAMLPSAELAGGSEIPLDRPLLELLQLD